MSIKRVYILGSGSSIGHSKGIFPSIEKFFVSARQSGVKLKEDYSLIVTYVKKTFGRNILRGKSSVDIEELFSYIDIEIERSFSAELIEMRQQLLHLIKSVLFNLERKVLGKSGEYNDFVSRLDPQDTIISFNWDLLLDNVLERETILKRNYKGQGSEVVPPQYHNFIQGLSALRERTIKHVTFGIPYSGWNAEVGYYLKMHGSIDWFYCSNESCRAFPRVFPLLELDQTHHCSECHEPIGSLLVPPTFNKEYRKYPLIRKIWNLAAKEMTTANELTIWGYSLPPTDFYSSWLLQQARKAPLNKLVIINPAIVTTTGKVRKTFVRRFKYIFLGKTKAIDIFLYKTFEDYAKAKDIPYK